ncbi:MAG: preprotein translocase subunit YajC [Candidatus Binataceae bacterium]
MWFEGIAWAQAAARGAAATPQSIFDQAIYGPVLPLVVIVGVIYFLMIRPQSKRANDHQKMVNALKRNDEVVTAGGLIGRIAELGDKLITLEIAHGVRVRVERGQITALSTYSKATAKKDKGD